MLLRGIRVLFGEEIVGQKHVIGGIEIKAAQSTGHIAVAELRLGSFFFGLRLAIVAGHWFHVPGVWINDKLFLGRSLLLLRMLHLQLWLLLLQIALHYMIQLLLLLLLLQLHLSLHELLLLPLLQLRQLLLLSLLLLHHQLLLQLLLLSA